MLTLTCKCKYAIRLFMVSLFVWLCCNIITPGEGLENQPDSVKYTTNGLQKGKENMNTGDESNAQAMMKKHKDMLAWINGIVWKPAPPSVHESEIKLTDVNPEPIKPIQNSSLNAKIRNTREGQKSHQIFSNSNTLMYPIKLHPNSKLQAISRPIQAISRPKSFHKQNSVRKTNELKGGPLTSNNVRPLPSAHNLSKPSRLPNLVKQHKPNWKKNENLQSSSPVNRPYSKYRNQGLLQPSVFRPYKMSTTSRTKPISLKLGTADKLHHGRPTYLKNTSSGNKHNFISNGKRYFRKPIALPYTRKNTGHTMSNVPNMYTGNTQLGSRNTHHRLSSLSNPSTNQVRSKMTMQDGFISRDAMIKNEQFPILPSYPSKNSDYINAPRALLFPGGKCKLSSQDKDSNPTGHCQPIQLPCTDGDTATEMCGRYYKCCVPEKQFNPTIKNEEHGAPQFSEASISTPDLTTLPSATLFPGGRCRLSDEASPRIGYCIPNTLPCKLNDEAPEICGQYHKCCVPGSNTSSLLRNFIKHETKEEAQTKMVPIAESFPGGMCKVLNGERVGYCRPNLLGCNPVQQYSDPNSNILKYEVIGECRSTNRHEIRMLCCAAKTENQDRHGNNLSVEPQNLSGSTASDIKSETMTATDPMEQGSEHPKIMLL